MSGCLQGKVAIVTGAAGGQGRASALRLAKEGADVGITDIKEAGLRETEAQAVADGGNVVAMVGDVSSLEHIDAFVSAVVERFGRVDVLHNSAGVLGPTGALDECTEDEWDRTLAVNAKAQFFLIQRVVPEMRKHGGGSIVNTASLAAVRGFDRIAPYSASKGAIAAMTLSLAVDLAPDKIRINAILPGGVDTPMAIEFRDAFYPGMTIPQMIEEASQRSLLKRFAQPEEIANAVVFLASDESSFSTGLLLPIDGGASSW